MRVRRIISDETVEPRQLPVEMLKAIATHIDLSFDAYSLGRLSPEEMKWDFNKEGKRFKVRYD